MDKLKSLYNITDEYHNIELMLLENNGELTEAVEQALTINKAELKEKSVNYVSVIKKMDSENNYIDKEIKRLQQIKKVRKNIIERLKNNIITAMEIYQIEKIETALIKISTRKSESIIIDISIDELPADCKKIKVEPISKTELKKRIKAGRKIRGVELVLKTSLNIK